MEMDAVVVDESKKKYSQLFKSPVPLVLLIDFLRSCTLRSCTTSTLPTTSLFSFVFDLHAFKRSVFYQTLQPFLDACQPYYFKSKQKYLCPQPLTFVSVATVIRQICRLHQVSFCKHMVYDKSSYEMVYLIEKKIET